MICGAQEFSTRSPHAETRSVSSLLPLHLTRTPFPANFRMAKNNRSKSACTYD
jgi:hypothetical protein